MQVWSLGWENPLEESMATHSSILVWRIPWTEEPDGLQSIGSQRVRDSWINTAQPSIEVQTLAFCICTLSSITTSISSSLLLCLYLEYLSKPRDLPQVKYPIRRRTIWNGQSIIYHGQTFSFKYIGTHVPPTPSFYSLISLLFIREFRFCNRKLQQVRMCQ